MISMLKTFIVFLNILIIHSLQAQDIWFKTITNDCNNFLMLDSDSIFIDYSCEQKDVYWGNYKINGDTIYMYVLYSKWNHHFRPSTIAAVKDDTTLTYIYREWKNNNKFFIKNYVMNKKGKNKLNKEETYIYTKALKEINKADLDNIKFDP